MMLIVSNSAAVDLIRCQSMLRVFLTRLRRFFLTGYFAISFSSFPYLPEPGLAESPKEVHDCQERVGTGISTLGHQRGLTALSGD